MSEQNTPVKEDAILAIANTATVESKDKTLKISFYTNQLDKAIYPTQMMRVAEVVINAELAVKLAELLHLHANRGNAQEVLKAVNTPLPKDFDPKLIK